VDRGGQTTLEGIANHTGLPAPLVRRILRNTHLLQEAVDVQEPCQRCGKEPAQAGSDFCLGCRLDLGEEIGEAADALASELSQEEVQPPAGKPVSNVPTGLEEKRRRTSTDALYPKRQRFK